MQPTVSTKLEKLPYFARIKTGPLRPLYCPDRQKHPLTLLKRQLSSFRAGFVRNKHFAPQMRNVGVPCVQTSPLWGRGVVLRLRQTISLFSVNIPPGIPLAKFANFMDFKVHFPVVSMNLRIQQLTKPCEGGWPCIDQNNWWFRMRFSSVSCQAVWYSKVFDGDFAKMREKIYMFKENIFIINAKDQGILATSNNQNNAYAVLMRTTEETAITSHTFDEIRQNSKTAHERVDWFIGGIFTRSNTISNTYHRIICTICL